MTAGVHQWALGLLLGLLLCHSATAETFRWASRGDPSSMDPHAAAVGTNLSFLGNIYEGLVRRGKDLRLEPALATRWEPLGDTGWRFYLRQNVVFHQGQAFNAEDVLFSYQRTVGEGSDVRAWMHSIAQVNTVDDYTIDFLTKAPNPIFPEEIANWLIMDKGWSEQHDAVMASKETPNHASSHTNGTGPFMLDTREAGIRTVLQAHPDWWDSVEHNLSTAEFQPVNNDATRVAALLSGEIDMIEPIPLQSVARIKNTAGFKVLQGGELRVIMLGFEHAADELRHSNIKGANPLQDQRVRQALYQAIDSTAINTKIMRGAAVPLGTVVAPGVNGYSEALGQRLTYDPEQAKQLLAVAGYANGFELGLRCPNDRYINDADICTAVVSMFSKIGIQAKLETTTVSKYWPQLRSKDFDMYMLGWTPGTYDAHHVMRFLIHTPNKEKKFGSWNFGGFSNPEIDQQIAAIGIEIDPGKRQALVAQVLGRVKQEFIYLPLHQQPLVWAMKENISLTQRADNFFNLRWVTVQ